MNKKRSLAVVLALLTALCLVLTGCGKPSTIEGYYDKDEDFKSEITSLEKANKGLKIIIKENAVTYDYDVAKAGIGSESLLKSDAMKKQLKSMLEKQGESQFVPLIEKIEKETKISGVTMEVVFRAGDTVLAKKTFKTKSE